MAGEGAGRDGGERGRLLSIRGFREGSGSHSVGGGLATRERRSRGRVRVWCWSVGGMGAIEALVATQCVGSR